MFIISIMEENMLSSCVYRGTWTALKIWKILSLQNWHLEDVHIEQFSKIVLRFILSIKTVKNFTGMVGTIITIPVFMSHVRSVTDRTSAGIPLISGAVLEKQQRYGLNIN
jgi:hypothetical protein